MVIIDFIRVKKQFFLTFFSVGRTYGLISCIHKRFRVHILYMRLDFFHAETYCPAVSGYVLDRDTDCCPSDSIAGPLADAYTACAAQKDCLGYVMYTSTSSRPEFANMSFTKKNLSSKSESMGMCLYSKTRKFILGWGS